MLPLLSDTCGKHKTSRDLHGLAPSVDAAAAQRLAKTNMLHKPGSKPGFCAGALR